MMKRKFCVGLFSVLFFASVGICAPSTQITYSTTDLGSGRWQNVYNVTNLSLAENIEEFTIWFDYDLYDNLTIETGNPPSSGWDELVWQPDSIWSINGGYDALTLGSGICQGQSIYGFAVSFDWLGTGLPQSQCYEIINPLTFQTIDSGQTSMIPAPGALLLTIIGLAALKSKKRLLQTS